MMMMMMMMKEEGGESRVDPGQHSKALMSTATMVGCSVKTPTRKQTQYAIHR